MLAAPIIRAGGAVLLLPALPFGGGGAGAFDFGCNGRGGAVHGNAALLGGGVVGGLGEELKLLGVPPVAPAVELFALLAPAVVTPLIAVSGSPIEPAASLIAVAGDVWRR